jgi:hypothetical protein
MDGGGGPDRGTNLLIGLVVVVAILYLRNASQGR